MDNAASLVALRSDLLASFSQSLEAIGLLDPFQVRGIVAGFWYQTKFDFLTLMARGAKGVADAWRTSILTALDDDRTLVEIAEEGWRENQGALGASYGNCQGWSQMLCALKMWIEHGINLRADMYK